MELRGEASIGVLRDVEELEQGSVKRCQGGRCAVACSGEVERDEGDRPQRFEEVVAGRAGRDVAGQQVGHLGDRAERAAGGAFEQAEDHERDAEDRDQADDALITGHKERADAQGAFGTAMAVLDLPLALPLREQGTRRGLLGRAGRLQDVVAVEGLEREPGPPAPGRRSPSAGRRPRRRSRDTGRSDAAARGWSRSWRVPARRWDTSGCRPGRRSWRSRSPPARAGGRDCAGRPPALRC